MMVVAHNMLAVNANRQFNIGDRKMAKSTERLTSGYKINRAADDAAGLSISEKMRNQIRNLHQAMRNINEGIDFVEVADGTLGETQSIMHRLEELAVKASNDVNTTDDRMAIDEEVQQLKSELHDIFNGAEFNTQKIFFTPYTPEITGSPNNMRLDYTTTDRHGGYAGLTINNTRHTWESIGVQFESDGVTFVGGTYEFTSGGEKVVLNMKAGAKIPNFERINTWEAKDNGIYVNDKLAATWSDMRINTSNVEAGKYSFSYQGLRISFDVNAGDNLNDIINGINNHDFNSSVSWSNYYMSTTVYDSAIDTTTGLLKDRWDWRADDYRDNFNTVLNPPVRYMDIQSGANAGEDTRVEWKGMNLTSVGLGSTNVTSRIDAENAIIQVQNAVKIVSAERSKLGAMQNRLVNCYNNDDNYAENLQSSESHIRDTDMAKEMLDYSKQSILAQVGQSMIAQANQQQKGILNLLS